MISEKTLEKLLLKMGHNSFESATQQKSNLIWISKRNIPKTLENLFWTKGNNWIFKTRSNMANAKCDLYLIYLKKYSLTKF